MFTLLQRAQTVGARRLRVNVVMQRDPYMTAGVGESLGEHQSAIQELAGHERLDTTLRYMHLSPAALTDAIALLDRPSRGRMLEAGTER